MLIKQIKRILNHQLTAEIFFLTTTFFWASTFFLVKESINIIPPFTFLSIRFLISSLFIFPIFLLIYSRNPPLSVPNILKKGVFTGIFLWLFFAFQTIGLKYTSSTIAAFLTALNVILTPVIARLIFKDNVQKKTIIASIIAFFGVFLILGVTESNISISTSALLGDFLILLSTIAIVFHILSTEKFSPQTDPVGMLLFQLVLSTILSILAMFIFNEYRISYFLPSEWDLTIWITLIVTVLFATLFGYFVQIYYQHKEVISGSRIALLLSFEPIFAAFIGFLFFAEVLTLIEYVGGFLVFSALIISRAENPKEKNVYFDP